VTQPAPLPPHEEERIAALAEYQILDSDTEPAFEAITELAAEICGVPIAVISLIDRDRQWFKSRRGLESTETPRDIAFCAHAILEPERLMEVPDAHLDPRFERNPLVLGDPHIRFYAGMPLRTTEGHALGTVCVIDREPRVLDANQRAALARLSTVVMALFETVRALRGAEHGMRTIANQVPAAIGYMDREQRVRFANDGYLSILGRDAGETLGRHVRELFGEDGYAFRRGHIEAALAGTPSLFEFTREVDGETRHWEGHYRPDFGADGSVRGYYGLSFDVTERRRAAAALAESEQRLRTISDNMPALICLIGSDGRYRFNNRTYEQWLGRPLAEITGRTLLAVHGERVWRLGEPYLARAFAGERVTFEYEVELGGEERFLRGVYVPHHGEHGHVTAVYGLTQDATDLWRSENRLRQLAEYDALTGLANRHRLMQQLEHELARSQRSGGGLGVLYLDLDRFKAINDEFGHLGGDLVLCEFARRLGTAVRETDLVARLAGDEFLIVLPDVDGADGAVATAERVIEAMARPFPVFDQDIPVSTSIGVALRRPADAGIDGLLRRADEALYAAKREGRNRYAVIA
jgi:diguanylate cyclase (GGDEF)-like protein/PAS domain S-box-containing protein